MNLVMLDIDGTLTLSYEYDRKIFRLAIAEVLECDPEEIELDNYVNTTSLGVTQEAFQRISERSPEAEEIEEVKRRVLLRLKKMYHESPKTFNEVPGASRFLERLRTFGGIGVAIATGAWLSEALFKLKASGLAVDGIPIATSDVQVDRKRIMEIAAEKAKSYYACHKFEHIIYLGDGPWDMLASRTLGYGFIGIGPRIEALKEIEKIDCYKDLMEVDAILASISALFEP